MKRKPMISGYMQGRVSIPYNEERFSGTATYGAKDDNSVADIP